MVISYEKFGKYQGKWVAMDIKTEEVVAADADASRLFELVEDQLDNKKPTIVFKYIHSFNVHLAP